MEVTRSKVPGSPADFRARQLSAQQMLRGDLEDADLEEYVEERLLLTRFEDAQNWARKNAIWPLGFGLACCAIEMITVIGSPRNDLARFGAEVIRFSPRQADMLILSGRVSIKMAPIIRRIYDQMLEPKWVISMGACASSAGMFNNYALVAGADKFLPIDVYVPGCPPRPEALIYGIMKLQDKIVKDPGAGLARALPARRAPRRPARRRPPLRRPRAPSPAARRPRGPLPDATGLELVAQRVRDAVAEDAVIGTHFAPTAQATLEVAPRSVRDVLAYLRDRDEEPYELPHRASTAATTCRRSPGWACTTSCSRMERRERLGVKTRVTVEEAERAQRDRPLPHRQLPRARGVRLLRRARSRATPTCAAS